MPSRSEKRAFHPVELIFALLKFLERTPTGPSTHLTFTRLPATSATVSTSSLTDTYSGHPMFVGPSRSDRVSLRMPSTMSSTYVYDRIAVPSPHTSMVPPTGASATLRQMAAGAFSRPPVQVPSGP